MKRGTAKAIKLGLKMIKWLEENDDRSKDKRSQWTSPNLDVYSHKDDEFAVRMSGYLKSHRTAVKFKKAFPELEKLERHNSSDTIYFTGNAELAGYSLEIFLSGITVLPANCEIVVKNVWHEEFITPAGYRKENTIVCNGAEKMEKAVDS